MIHFTTDTETVPVFPQQHLSSISRIVLYVGCAYIASLSPHNIVNFVVRRQQYIILPCRK